MKLAGDQPVVVAQQGADEGRRAGIDLQAVRVEAADDVEITAGCGNIRVDDAGNTVGRLAGLAGLDRGEVIEADAGMGVDDRERLRLPAQMFEQHDQHRVLEHLGVVARVIGVAVVHSCSLFPGGKVHTLFLKTFDCRS